MANVMLSSESSKVPSKPFKIRIQELRSIYHEVLNEISSVIEDQEEVGASSSTSTSNAAEVMKKIDGFNLACDDIYKEIQRRKQLLVMNEEGVIPTNEVHQQLQAAGNLLQEVDDFRAMLLKKDVYVHHS